MRAATLLGKIAGRRVYRFPVVVTFNNPLGTVDEWISPPYIETDVVSHSARDAAAWAQEHVARYRECTEVEVFGPKGGRTHRFTGYESAVWHAMCEPRAPQLALEL